MTALRSIARRLRLAALLVAFAAGCATTSEIHVQQPVERLYTAQDPQFARSMGDLLGPALLPGNHVEALSNGDEIFPAMLSAIRSAQQTISFETYIYWSGSIGREFAEALSERARAGVRVHVLLDWFGSLKMNPELIDQMKQAGVQVLKYHKPRWYQLHRLNNRTHRKLLIVDGREGFTGGVGIADEWRGHAQDPEHWRDSHYRLVGPAVAQMQAAFMENWIKVSGEVLHGADYFPALSAQGEGRAQVFSSSPTGGAESMRLMYLLAISAASHTIHLSTPYFVPDALSRKALIDAANRGVKVQVITVGPVTDAQLVRHASRARWGELLEAGIEIYEFQPTLYHVKAMMVDGLWAAVGSTNFDPRSFNLNDEDNLSYFDAGFAQRLDQIFEQDRARSRRISLQEWKDRPFSEKFWDRAANLLGPQL